MVNQTIIATVKNYITQIPKNLHVKNVYLFGSYAKGHNHSDSDIDIAVVVADRGDFFTIQMQLMRLRRKIDLRIEPHPIFESDFSCENPFAFEIQKSGIEISM
jgi:predicted nucleotidyltransferase